jgi:hypothetical protein
MTRWDETPRCLADLVVIDVDGRARGIHHRVQGAPLMRKLVLAPLLVGAAWTA